MFMFMFRHPVGTRGFAESVLFLFFVNLFFYRTKNTIPVRARDESPIPNSQLGRPATPTGTGTARVNSGCCFTDSRQQGIHEHETYTRIVGF